MIKITKALENICSDSSYCPFDTCPFDDEKECNEVTWKDWLELLQKRKAPIIAPAKCCNNCKYYNTTNCTLRSDTLATMTSYCEAFSKKITPVNE